ncbi:MAG: DEAD/DEAH box helicase [Alphaproteobacteria bacterium]|nr:DEAD/DEAH box helicase [Alphaproteobacteria bacterium]
MLACGGQVRYRGRTYGPQGPFSIRYDSVTLSNTSPALARALDERAYHDLTPVQSAVLTSDTLGRDIVVSAQTGSGKTVAFGLAIAPDLLQDAEHLGVADKPLALIIAPTRELALQVEKELAWLYQYAKARIVSCVGGMDPRNERRRLMEGAHIVVGTPGRLRDHIERNALDVSDLKVLVLDEADEMLEMGFREDLEFILETTPAELEYRAIRVFAKETEFAVVNLLRQIEAPTAIVFCNTRDSVRHLQAILQERGFSAVLLSGELSQHERNQSMQALRDGRARVCVATDVAARGLDLPSVTLVIHAELPNDAETLQHRSGRTGRAGRKGISALLVPHARRRRAEQLLREGSINAKWMAPPTADEIHKLDQERMLQDPLLADPPAPEDFVMAKALLAEKTAEELGAALIKIYRSRLPAIEDISDPGQEPEHRPRHEKRKDWSPLQEAEGRRERHPARDKESGHHNRTMGERVWFRLDIGRKKNADPKWILPMLCRKGNIQKKDIGAIRIFDSETKFEIDAQIADLFATNMRKPGGETFKIDRLGANSDSPARPRKFDAPAEGGEEPRSPKKFKSDFHKPAEGKKGPYPTKPRAPEGKERTERPPFKSKKRDFDGKPAEFEGRAYNAEGKPTGYDGKKKKKKKFVPDNKSARES